MQNLPVKLNFSSSCQACSSLHSQPGSQTARAVASRQRWAPHVASPAASFTHNVLKSGKQNIRTGIWAASAATEAADGSGLPLQPHQEAQPAAPALPLPPSRLEREVQQLVAIDVEYTHLQLLPGKRHVSLAAEVCAVDAEGRVLLLEFCNPLEGKLAQQRWRHVGGLPPASWQYAAPLAEVRQRLRELLQGRILVGHHLRKDLAALALTHPAEAQRDTLRYRELQGRGGSGRKLRDLSAERLGRSIQRAGRRHSPREDAQAALDLYLQHVHFQERYMQYDDLVQRHLADILSSCSSSMDEGSAGEGSEEDGEGEGSSGGCY